MAAPASTGKQPRAKKPGSIKKPRTEPINVKSTDKLVDAATAVAMLGVKLQSLYAYVSRGWVRAVPAASGKGNLYFVEDLEALGARGRSRGDSVSAERVIRWGGGAIMQTAITSIGPDGPRYRGNLAADLAASQRPFEDCAELLWNGILPDASVLWQPVAPGPEFQALSAGIAGIAGRNPSRRLLAVVVEAYAASLGKHPELTLGAPALAGRQLVQVMAAALGLLGEQPEYVLSQRPQAIAALVADRLRVRTDADALWAINAALILSADNELAPATFAARIAASAGSDIFSCVTTALGAFEGMLTGVGCDEAEAMLRQTANDPDRYLALLAARIDRKSPLAGYNHPLYPAGDPRARLLMDIARQVVAPGGQGAVALHCIDQAQARLLLKPNLPLGLLAVCLALEAPAGAAGAVMALGRTAGWIAHALEQRLAGFLVRPRARYVGP
ncbi:citrate/2-methylcitrate synthase [Achromobacter deleyi]|uniref:citrate/2-methylcitrate synthase n=1 Tax=Achromobacter deleyi TaxID=1353891 RepID=UPI0014658746|nr:citrate/2-methylcitrate synthase [Achromobacter deleyi]CAB3837904.1 hypothetical protein LMG3412_01091 [Achromobacter deleyi]